MGLEVGSGIGVVRVVGVGVGVQNYRDAVLVAILVLLSGKTMAYSGRGEAYERIGFRVRIGSAIA
jgi:hypothetical protein